MTLGHLRPQEPHGRGIPRLAWRLAWLIAFLGAFLASASAAETNPPISLNTRQPEITRAREVMRLSLTEAGQYHPVRLRGVITLFFGRDNLCFLQDDSAGVYLYDPQANPNLKAGNQVEIIGASGSGLFSPFVLVTNITVLGTQPLPPAKRLSLDQIAAGNDDSQWAEVEGIVHFEREEFQYWLLEIVAGNNRLQVRVVNIQQPPALSYVDSFVRVRGVVASQFNRLNQLIGFQLLVPSFEEIHTLTPPIREPFSLPIQPITNLSGVLGRGSSGHRARVRGIVTMHRLGESVFLKDQGGSLMARTSQTTPLTPGDVIDVVGFPTYESVTPMLHDAIYRKAGVGPPPHPLQIGAQQPLKGGFNNELVELSGLLARQEWSQSNRICLVIQDGSNTFRAFLPFDETNSPPEIGAKNSTVSVTGICQLDIDKNRNPIGWHLDLRSPSDIRLIKRPAQWQLARLLWGLGIIAVATLIGLIWLATLRYRVGQETASLRLQEKALEDRYRDLFENANDIIFTLDNAGYFTSWNQAGERLTGYSRAEVTQMKLENLVTTEYRAVIQEAMARAHTQANIAPFDVEILTKHTRTFYLDISIRSVYNNARNAGWRGIARDISGRKQAEEVVRQSEKQLRRFLLERERIGRDLHDGIIQSIYGVGLGLEDCRNSLSQDPTLANEQLKRTIKDLNQIIRDVRRFIQGLNPEALQAQDLASALQSLVLSYEESNTIRLYLDIQPEATRDLEAHQAAHLFFIIREAVSNCARHAQAKKARISLSIQESARRLEITDDGEGFNPQLVIDKGLGLRNMAARAHELGGQISVFSEPGNGTRVLVVFPFLTPYDSK